MTPKTNHKRLDGEGQATMGGRQDFGKGGKMGERRLER